MDSSPPTVGIFRPEYWSGLPFTTRRDPPDPEIEPESLASPVLAGGFFTTTLPGKPLCISYMVTYMPQCCSLSSSHTHLPPLCPMSVFCVCISIHQHHFSRFHIHALIDDICFSLSDLLHSALVLGSSTSLEQTQMHSLLWLSNHRIYVPQLSYPFISGWTPGCFHVLAVVNSAAVNMGHM